MKNYAQVTAISNGTLVSYLEPTKHKRPGPRVLRVVDREVDGLAEELGVAWKIQWRTIYCKDLDAVQAAVKQAFYAQSTLEDLEKKGVHLNFSEPYVQYPAGVYGTANSFQ